MLLCTCGDGTAIWYLCIYTIYLSSGGSVKIKLMLTTKSRYSLLPYSVSLKAGSSALDAVPSLVARSHVLVYSWCWYSIMVYILALALSL